MEIKIKTRKFLRYIFTYLRVCESVFQWPFIFCFFSFILLNLANIILCNNNANASLSEQHIVHNDGSSTFIWSDFLEDYVLSQSPSNRQSKDLPYMSNFNEMSPHGPMQHGMMHGGPHSGPINYHSSAYKRPAGQIYITKRVGEAFELEPHMRPPVEVANSQFRPMTNQMLQQQQQQQQQQRQQSGFLQQLFGFVGGNTNPNPSLSTNPQQQHVRPITLPQQQQQQQQLQLQQQQLHQQQQQQQQQLQQQQQPLLGQAAAPQAFRAVSENDLYLLGAIEKLVYRVDYLESRVRRTEQLIYYLMAGNNQKEVRDPCPTNFTRISDTCYYINSQQQVNWKTANTACKAVGAHLAEFEKVSENEEIMAYILNQPNHRGRDYWLGGLNPGLLWIWSNSAKPVNPNTNLTSIAMSHKADSNATETNLVEDDPDDDDDNAAKQKKKTEEAILNNTAEIKGQGRCLRLTYNSTKHAYAYYGQECTTRHHYICETEDKTLDNKIKKITRELKLFD